MTSLLAEIRPDSWNVPPLVHVAGAAVLVGAVLTAVSTTLTADRTSHADLLRRIAFGSLLAVGLPAYVAMRVGGEWLDSKRSADSDDPAWLVIGYVVADLGLLVLVLALVLAGVAAWKRHGGLGRASGALCALLLVALLVVAWAMGAKPD